MHMHVSLHVPIHMSIRVMTHTHAYTQINLLHGDDVLGTRPLESHDVIVREKATCACVQTCV